MNIPDGIKPSLKIVDKNSCLKNDCLKLPLDNHHIIFNNSFSDDPISLPYGLHEARRHSKIQSCYH
jgi:hypothetical protein